MILCKNNELIIRDLEKKDKYLMLKWLSNKEILKYYEGRDKIYDMRKIDAKFYSNRDKNRCIIEYYKKPIGYIQFYPIIKDTLEKYGLYKDYGITYGTDQFIGESIYLGKRIGESFMNLIISYLKDKEKINTILLDPQIKNKRAIKCYKKCGFEILKLLPKHELHEGELKDCLLMIKTL